MRPSAYQVPSSLKSRYVWLSLFAEAEQRIQNVPFDQSIRLPSLMSVPVMNRQPGAKMVRSSRPRPIEAFVDVTFSVRKDPLSVIVAG